ncbi:MAG TPA: hypothetical protein PKD53_25705 [Chloroflexaceae bacterium]|nr:hypothetical protein [Chloroflexaceae bacterium]
MSDYYIIRVRGHLASHWADWFAPLIIRNEPQGEALLAGRLPDQAALHGVLVRIRDLGLPLISIASGAPESPGEAAD